jgi:hypothetical protein
MYYFQDCEFDDLHAADNMHPLGKTIVFIPMSIGHWAYATGYAGWYIIVMQMYLSNPNIEKS